MTTGVYQRPPAIDRLLEKVEGAALFDCWLWRGASTTHGYGTFWLDGRLVHAHRAAYTLFVGPIPDGLDIDHRCRTRLCVNPAHLEAVTHLENVRRGLPFREPRTRCPRGHDLTADNTYVAPTGGRRCRVCARAQIRAWHQKRRSAA